MDEVEQRWLRIQRAWTGRRWDDWLATTAPDYRFAAGDGPIRDRRETLGWSRALFTAFPDYREAVLATHSTADTLVAELDCAGTFRGPLVLAGRTLEPTGRAFRLDYCKVLTFGPDGLTHADRQYVDNLALLGSIGALG